MHLTLNL
jgi:hypothetical protein